MIRAPRAQDARDLAAVHVAAWREAYKEDFPSDFLEGLDVARRTTWFESQIGGRSGLLVAEGAGRVVGFCLFGASTDPGWGELFAIYVSPDHWGQGHGYRLLGAAEDDLQTMGFEKAMLWVLASNQRARAFYERQGWSLGKPIRLEDIGGRQVTEVRYERLLRAVSSPSPDRAGR